MVLWEITLGTAYFLGLKRTYKLALKIQRRLIKPNHPKLRDFVYRSDLFPLIPDLVEFGIFIFFPCILEVDLVYILPNSDLSVLAFRCLSDEVFDF